MESAAIYFERDAFGHLNAIAVDKGGKALFLKANIGQDEGVLDVTDKDKFIAAAKIRQGPGKHRANLGIISGPCRAMGRQRRFKYTRARLP